ncbi:MULTISPECIES: double-strand break repair protein AddB [Mesorhizobium]|uniref:Double-strand break repair protein AddB n=1 Tax=Mesorhizobium denitrificans TaxID=2294114 RepID=A0A371XH71_9HYPH|nr:MULTISPECIES: double-strand break repair protein AddB [Mesorhizobium]RFC68570.1 double-strand break repair protein AddB [Mesorhizobium denitrificans]
MIDRIAPRLFTIAPGTPFLPTLASALAGGELVPGFQPQGDPLAIADATIFVPTRRAARELRAAFAEFGAGKAAILPTIKALGEFDAEEAAFDASSASLLSLTQPISAIDRLLLLAPLVKRWKERLPQSLADLYNEHVIVPASTADAIWLARDLAELIDEVELEGADWTQLRGLVTDNLAGWWQVTLDFLEIVTAHWPQILEERGQSNPAAHRDALLRAEAKRLALRPPAGPVIAAGSTGSIPATAALLSVISRLPNGAVVLPGLDTSMDENSWTLLGEAVPDQSVFGHPQFGLAKLLKKLGVTRSEVVELGLPPKALVDRAWIVSEALRPAEATDVWLASRTQSSRSALDEALAAVTLVEAANERDEATTIATALRLAIEDPGKSAALVTGDRNLARRVATELRRFGIEADDSGGTPLSNTPPAGLLRLLVLAAFEPGDAVAILSLLKHPLIQLGLPRAVVRRAAECIELIALRGGVGRPDISALDALFERKLEILAHEGTRQPHWLARLDLERLDEARAVLRQLRDVFAPLAALRPKGEVVLFDLLTATVTAFEALGRAEDGTLADLYGHEAGVKLAEVLREAIGSTVPFGLAATEWPSVLSALIAPEVVKPSVNTDPRISIWGALEARLQSVDTLILGGMNEGSWPRKAEADRLMSRVMKAGISLEPPERRIGLAAHDFQMAMGARRVILTGAARDGDAPAVASRWLQRLLAFIGADQAQPMKARGDELLRHSRALDESARIAFAPRPQPTPPLDLRPKHFSVTEIETLRRDPYAIYAKRILDLKAIDPLIRDPGAAERGTLFHDILHRFSISGVDPRAPEALQSLLADGRACFAEADLPTDVYAVWWPRFESLAVSILEWEDLRADNVVKRHAEVRAEKTPVGTTGVTLSGYADRVDLLREGLADILDYKTGSYPSTKQAQTLLSPQLALEAALLELGAFHEFGSRQPADLAYVRLKPNGEVEHQSILKGSQKSGRQLAFESWERLRELLLHYQVEKNGYLSRALPFRENATSGDYDHLARVLEWSAGGDTTEGDEE